MKISCPTLHRQVCSSYYKSKMIDANYESCPPLLFDHTCTTIFLGTDPPSLPMMLSNSSKLILPSMSLSAYARVLMMVTYY